MHCPVTNKTLIVRSCIVSPHVVRLRLLPVRCCTVFHLDYLLTSPVSVKDVQLTVLEDEPFPIPLAESSGVKAAEGRAGLAS